MPDQIPQPPPQPDLASFGDELRREREIRGISLKEISDATKISKRFLEAIERNDHKTLPAPVFTRGFIREYARYLGLNAEEMVSRYNCGAAGDDRIDKSVQLERLVQLQGRDRARKMGIPPAYARVDPNVYILILIIAALAVVSFWAFRHKGEARVDAETARLEVSTVPIKAAVPVVADAAPAPPPEEILRLTIELKNDCWITLEADGKTVVNDDLKRGERRTFEAREQFRFRTIGNAAGVVLTLNNAKLPPLGREGQVLHNRTLDRQYLERLGLMETRSTT